MDRRAPARLIHRGPQAASASHSSAGYGSPLHAPNAALLIDFDNVTMGIRSDLGRRAPHASSAPRSSRARSPSSAPTPTGAATRSTSCPLAESSIDMIMAPAYGSSKKNATDIRLAVDAIELVFTRPEIGTYILLSGDSDFAEPRHQAQGVRQVRHRRRHPRVVERPARHELRRVLQLQRPRRPREERRRGEVREVGSVGARQRSRSTA